MKENSILDSLKDIFNVSINFPGLLRQNAGKNTRISEILSKSNFRCLKKI